MGGIFRAVFAVLTGGMATGCLISPPPDYREPASVRPELHVFDAKPTVSQIQVVESGLTTVYFRIPVKLVPGAGEFSFQLWRNYDLDDTELIQNQPLPSDSEVVEYDWLVPRKITAGCHQVTLLVAHASSFGGFGPRDPVIVEEARDDVAQISWWFNVDPALGQQQTLTNCPDRPTPSP